MSIFTKIILSLVHYVEYISTLRYTYTRTVRRNPAYILKNKHNIPLFEIFVFQIVLPITKRYIQETNKVICS